MPRPARSMTASGWGPNSTATITAASRRRVDSSVRPKWRQAMPAGPLLVTYQLTERSKAIVAEELGGAAEVIYLPELPDDRRAEAPARARAGPADDTSTQPRAGGAPAPRKP